MDAADLADAASNSRTFETVARAAFAVNGVLHLLIGYAAIRLASGHGAKPSQAGVLTAVANEPGGAFALWVAAITFAALTIWHALELCFGRGYRSTYRRVMQKGSSVGLILIYGALAIVTVRYALGGTNSHKSNARKSDLSVELMQTLAGRLFLAAVGATIFGIGVFFVVKGLRRAHRKNLKRTSGFFGRTAVVLGMIGYIAKGLVICSAGMLVGYSTITFEPAKAEGISTVFRTIQGQPTGPAGLVAAGLGLASYGLYLGCRARFGTMPNDY
nr:DUF1206 domain-containing protein [Spelaeicoccus albus]